MASQPDVLQSCLQDAAKTARSALERCMDSAIAVLQDAELHSMKVAERDELAEAWRRLQDNKPSWPVAYQAELAAAFAQATETADAARASGSLAAPRHSAPSPLSSDFGLLTSGPRDSGSMGLETFSLVDDDHVTKAIESSRLLQQILPGLEQSLAELDSLISSAQGLQNVRPDLNPLRPDVFTRTLQSIMAGATSEPTLVATWIKQLAKPLGREIKDIYEKTILKLEKANVPAAQYRVLQTPASAMGRNRRKDTADENGKGAEGTDFGGLDGGGGGDGSGGGHGNGQNRPPSQYADLSNYEIRDELFQDFLFHGGSNAHHGLAPSYYETVEEELNALKEAESASAPLEPRREDDSSYKAMPAVDRPQRHVDVSSPLSPKVWGAYGRSRERAIVRTQLKKEATKVGQVLGLEVVRKLVNQVAQDPRLLVPVREAIVALEPSLLRLAMLDPRFFSDEGHPGRRLMERVAQRSFKYNDEFSPEFNSFFGDVTRAFNELNGLTIEDARPFGMALATLEHAWDEQDHAELKARQNVLKALNFAEDRQELADRIAFDLSSRSDLDNVPGVVLDFLFGPWSLAMAHAKLTDQRNQVDPEGFGSVVPDLLWSVKREVTLKRPAKLIEMIPGLLDKLHQGLDMLGQAPQENEKFFEALLKLHQPVLKLRRLKSRRDAEESGTVPLETEAMPATPEQRRARIAEQPWLGKEELDAAGFEDTQPTEPADLESMHGGLYSASMEAAEAVPGAEAGDTEGAGLSDTQPAQACTEPAPEAEAPATPASKAPASTDDLPVLTDTVPAPVVATPAPLKPRPPGLSPSEAEAILFSLKTGSWVDLYSKHHWLRAQLVWASTKATLFMFISHGGQPHSMTKRSCEKLISQRLLRPVDTHAVIAKAMDAVAAEVVAAAPPAAADSNPAPFSEQHNEPATA